jgi:hypothetical protein
LTDPQNPIALAPGQESCVMDTLWISTKDTEEPSHTAQGTDAPTNKEKEEMRPSWIPITMSLMLILTASLMFALPAVLAADLKPTDGWTLHIDAKRHFPSKPNLIAITTARKSRVG